MTEQQQITEQFSEGMETINTLILEADTFIFYTVPRDDDTVTVRKILFTSNTQSLINYHNSSHRHSSVSLLFRFRFFY